MGRNKENETKKALQAQRLHLVRSEYNLSNKMLSEVSGIDPKNLSKILQGKRSVTDNLARSVNDIISPDDNGIYEYLSGAASSVDGMQPSISAIIDDAEMRDRRFINYLLAAGHKIFFVASLSGDSEKYLLSPMLFTCLHHSILNHDLYEVKIADVVEKMEVSGAVVDNREISLSDFWNLIDRAQVITDHIVSQDFN